MTNLLVARFKEKDLIKYPDQEYEGIAEMAAFSRDPSKFNFETNLCSVKSAELIQFPLCWLRGIITQNSQEYVFSAKIDLRNFDEIDYQELLKQAIKEIEELEIVNKL